MQNRIPILVELKATALRQTKFMQRVEHRSIAAELVNQRRSPVVFPAGFRIVNRQKLDCRHDQRRGKQATVPHPARLRFAKAIPSVDDWKCGSEWIGPAGKTITHASSEEIF
jgi:hypothetical protein